MGKKALHFWIEPDSLARKGIDFCSLEAQGLWLKVMRQLHASERYGYLSRDGFPVSDEQSARRCGIDVTKWVALVSELLEFDLLKRSADGILFSPELVAQAEWRASGAKRQKDFQDKQRQKKQNPEKYNGSNNGEYNGYITPDITPESRPNLNSKSFSSSKEKEKERGGGNADNNTPRAKGKPPPAAANPEKAEIGDNPKIVLTESEKKMSDADYLDHLKKYYPGVEVEAVFIKLKNYCARPDVSVTPSRLRLKKWCATEDEEFSPDVGTGKSKVGLSAEEGEEFLAKKFGKKQANSV